MMVCTKSAQTTIRGCPDPKILGYASAPEACGLRWIIEIAVKDGAIEMQSRDWVNGLLYPNCGLTGFFFLPKSAPPEQDFLDVMTC